MTVSRMSGHPADTSTDWLDGVDSRVPVALLRHVAASAHDVGSALAAVMELALRRTAVTGSIEAVPATAPARRTARRAQIEPRALPADIGVRLLAELREVASEHLRSDDHDATLAMAALSEALAVRLGVPVPVARVGVAVALTSRAEAVVSAQPVPRIPCQREPRPISEPAVDLMSGSDTTLLSVAPAPA